MLKGKKCNVISIKNAPIKIIFNWRNIDYNINFKPRKHSQFDDRQVS